MVGYWSLLIRWCFKFGKGGCWKLFGERRLRWEEGFKLVSSCFKLAVEVVGGKEVVLQDQEQAIMVS